MSARKPAAQDRERIESEAAYWIVLGSEGLGPAEKKRFEAWLASDSRHLDVWRAVGETWDIAEGLTGLGPMAPSPAMRRSGRPLPTLSRALATAACVAAAVAVTLSALRPHPLRYSTQIAETRAVLLADGTRVTLGPRSTLEVALGGGERRAKLMAGEAFFEVTHDPWRPFSVEVGNARVQDLGTKFDIDYDGSSATVAVLDGLVGIHGSSRTSRTAPMSQLLRSSERAELLFSPKGQASLKRLPTGVAGSWRTGRLTYEDARLADVVADINRYFAPGVIIADAAVEDVRITSSFEPREIPAFISAVSDVAPVRTEVMADGSFRLHALRA